MFEFLKSIFGENIALEEYHFPSNTPYYIRDNYHAQNFCWNKYKCILLAPTSTWRLPTLKKQFAKIQEISAEPCAFLLENLTSLQRKNLLESGIPFVSVSQQIFLPF